MSKPHDRPATSPGGMDCQECGVIFVGEEWHHLCAVCEKAKAEEERHSPPGRSAPSIGSLHGSAWLPKEQGSDQ